MDFCGWPFMLLYEACGYPFLAMRPSIGCKNRASPLRSWPEAHRGICKDNLSLYLAASETYGGFDW